ncbi:MAG: c-type cytochrome [Gemmatimonadales bacterium]
MSRPGCGKPTRPASLGPLLAVVLAGLPPCSPGLLAQAPHPDEGKRVFQSICVACHTVGAGVRMGPDLKGVTERRERMWLMRFIRDPEQLRREGDSLTIALMAQYGVRMPSLGLTDPQLEAVIGYLAASQAPPPTRPALFLPTLVLALVAIVGSL